MYYRINAGGISEEAIRSYRFHKKRMGEMIRAKMTAVKNAPHELTLFDIAGNTLTIVSGITSGTYGTGSRGTFEILVDAGFWVSPSFVIEHSDFDIGRDGERYGV